MAARFLLVAMMLQLLAQAALAQGFDLQVVVKEGDPAPGTGSGVFDRLVSVDLDNAGGVVFNATITGGTAAQGVFLVEGGVVTPIAVSGDSAPGTATTFSSFGGPVARNAAGDTIFASALAASPFQGLFRHPTGGTLSEVAFLFDPAPDTGGGMYFGGTAPSSNDAGTVVFGMDVTGGTTSRGLFQDVGGTQTARAVVGDAAPGTGGGTLATIGYSKWGLNDAGEALLQADVSGGTTVEGIFRASGGSLTDLVIEGAAAPDTGGGSFSEFSFPSAGAAGAGVFHALVTGGSSAEGIFRIGTSAVVVEGDPAPQTGGASFTGFGTIAGGKPATNTRGEVAFFASNDAFTGKNGIYLATGGKILEVVRSGQPVPDEPGLSFTSMDADPAVNDPGQVAFWTSGNGDIDLIVLATPPPTIPSSGPLGILLVAALLASSAGHLLRRRG